MPKPLDRTTVTHLPNDFSAIGFQVSSEQEFFELAKTVVSDAVEISVSGGSLRRWSDPSGAELWVQVDPAGDIVGMDPHFVGGSSVRVGLDYRVVNPSGTILDGWFYAWASPREDARHGDYPFVFFCPEFYRYSDVGTPALATAQVAAFARSPLEVSDDTTSPQMRERGHNGGSFVPSGTFRPEGGLIEPPEPLAFMRGRVRESSARVNGLTGRAFYALEVESYGGDYSVVVDPAVMHGLPEPGAIVSGNFWLSGRFVDGTLRSV